MTRIERPAEDDWRWQAIELHDKSADGRFWYSVATTGVYCRPSCPSRRPLRRNVTFHATREAAETAGFRPCRRCRPREDSPDGRQAALVAAACKALDAAIDAGDAEPRLADLAATAGLSPFHFHRVFRQHAGVTPKQYAAGRRAERMRDGLRSSASVTEAIYDAGYSSSSRFYERSDEVLGMTASAWRKGGRGVRIRFAVGECSLGAILVAATERGVCAIEFGDDPQALVESLQDRFPDAVLVGADPEFERLVAEVVGFVEAPGRGLDLKLDVAGTAFQHRVWQALRAIPPGERASYAEIARRIGMPKAVRAVAQACASNPAALAIPCHRVVRTDGALSGYRWGVERKRTLLEREAAA
ncbi:MAG TPA: bifunctional DNA-binding transcriptional regulator/O6-methylguanine-DNA methyltransferase Ada [Stellaceae bacterium]|nr:bifunctional DNA-binding transcriptional regulator/O6-methylguanine-DNA methyltransferase Ada [Stellaceae bacterium]